MKKTLLASAVSLAMAATVQADQHSGTYAFDTQGAHQFITFEISHLGYSTLYGRFNDFEAFSALCEAAKAALPEDVNAPKAA